MDKKVKRILILGPESTGKSTLAEDLAKYFDEPWVPEFAREYLEKTERPYEFEDLSEIGKGQLKSENELEEKARRYLFCDTDLRVIYIWSEHRFGKTAPWVLDEIQNRRYDLVLLTATDLPWTADPLREHPQLEMRQYFFEKYLELTEQSGFPYLIISGDREKRLKTSVEAIEALKN